MSNQSFSMKMPLIFFFVPSFGFMLYYSFRLQCYITPSIHKNARRLHWLITSMPLSYISHNQ